MSDIRSYSTIAEHADPSELAGQLNVHRAAMNKAILGEGARSCSSWGTPSWPSSVPRSPRTDHADRAVAAALAMHDGAGRDQRALGRRGPASLRARAWAIHRRGGGRPLGSEERLEYTLVGDTVNLSQRLQQLAGAGRDRAVRPRLARSTCAGARVALGAAGEGPRHARRRPARLSPQSHRDDRHRPPTACWTPKPDRHDRAGNGRHECDGMIMDALVVHGVRKTFEAENAPGAGAARRRPGRQHGRVRRAHGPVGLWQVDVAQSGRRAGRGRRGHDHGRRRGGDRHGPRTSWPAAAAPHRHRLPVLQPPRGDDRARERRPAGRSSPGRKRKTAESRARDLLDLLGIGDKATACPACSPAASASASPSPGPWPTSRRCCWPTSRPVPSTPTGARR